MRVTSRDLNDDPDRVVRVVRTMLEWKSATGISGAMDG